MDQDIKEIQEKIKTARKWARKHFNADRPGDAPVDENLNILPMKFSVEFPDVDRMIVNPTLYGQKMKPTVEYRLKFLGDGRVAWQGSHPYYGYDIAPLVVEEQ